MKQSDEADHCAEAQRPVDAAADIHDHRGHGLEERELERHLPRSAEDRELRDEQVDALLVIDQRGVRSFRLPER
jgi:hypothetical protein